ncbi:MAG TPA: gas vesicle protein, partial [Bacteroidetes bacterium]|nr:gas vesicle protein [Bacteroidota bacterium]
SSTRGETIMKPVKVVLGVLAGAAAGAIVGMLIAPRKGSATRMRIARTGAEYAEEAKDKFNEYVDAVTEEYDTVKESAKTLVGRGKEKVASAAAARRAK